MHKKGRKAKAQRGERALKGEKEVAQRWRRAKAQKGERALKGEKEAAQQWRLWFCCRHCRQFCLLGFLGLLALFAPLGLKYNQKKESLNCLKLSLKKWR